MEENMGGTLPRDLAATFDELARAARDVTAIRQDQHGPLDADDPLDEAIARVLRHVRQLEADTA
jgi:hypothetical protein